MPFTTTMSILLIIWASSSGAAAVAARVAGVRDVVDRGPPDGDGVTLILAVGVVGATMILLGPASRASGSRSARACLPASSHGSTCAPSCPGTCSGGDRVSPQPSSSSTAFGVTSSLNNALLALVAAAIAGGIPLTPGGLGAKQALLLVLLAGQGTTTAVVAFSIGMEVTIIVGQLVAGLLAFGVLTKGFRVRSALAEARRSRRAERAAASPEAPRPD